MLLQNLDPMGTTTHALTWGGFINNLVPVLLGNILGGSVFVGFVYHVIYQPSDRTSR
jgi:formate/nitrite transporter FocA (FNT family)